MSENNKDDGSVGEAQDAPRAEVRAPLQLRHLQQGLQQPRDAQVAREVAHTHRGEEGVPL